MSCSQDVNLNENVRIYHHSQHLQFRKRSSIFRLQTSQGIVEGHGECAKALESNISSHLSKPADLDPVAQELLLEEVEVSFTDEDNTKLRPPPSKTEVKTVLDSCRPHATPGTDGLTVYLYQQCWEILVDPLTEVVQELISGGKPTPSQCTSLMMFRNKPGKSKKSLDLKTVSS